MSCRPVWWPCQVSPSYCFSFVCFFIFYGGLALDFNPFQCFLHTIYRARYPDYVFVQYIQNDLFHICPFFFPLPFSLLSVPSFLLPIPPLLPLPLPSPSLLRVCQSSEREIRSTHPCVSPDCICNVSRIYLLVCRS